MEFGIANLSTMTVNSFTNATDLKTFGLLRLKSVMREEGFKFNATGIRAYMDSWLEWEADCNDDDNELYWTPLSTCGSQLVDVAADTLTYTNVHLHKLATGSNRWMPLTSEDKEIFMQAIVDKLEEAF
tara:strand:+ start:2300 stop:2683 length:384 start_codon:yes stop_codon:yes gene_type:complete